MKKKPSLVPKQLVLFLSGCLLYPVCGSVVHLVVLISHCSQPAAQFHVRTLSDGERGELPGQQAHNVLDEHGLGIGRSLFGLEVGQLYHLLVVEHLLEVFVLLRDALVVVVLEPVAAPLVQLLVELSIELVVVDIARIVNLVGIDADEAARAGGVGQWTQVVGGGNERGEALAFLHRLAVGRAELDVVF